MIKIDKEWIAVDRDDRIVAKADTKSAVKAWLDHLGLDRDDYEIVAVPKVNPPTGVGWSAPVLK